MTAPTSSGPALPALFEQHKTAVLGGAAAAVVGLALLRKKKTAAGATGAPAAGTIPAAGVVSSGSVQSAYPNTTATDVFNSLQPTLEAILNQQGNATGTGAGAPLAGPKPISSTLFAPNLTGQYVKYSNGTVGEIESDGSVYGISAPELSSSQWDKVYSAGITDLPSTINTGSGPAYGDRVNNLVKPATT